MLGGWLIDVGSWRFAFLVNLPLAAAAIWLAVISVPADSDDGSNSLDAAGAFLATVGLGLATWALTEGSGHGWTPLTLAVMATAILFLIAFVWTQHRLGDKAMMPLVLFGSPSFVGLTVARTGGLVTTALIGSVLMMTGASLATAFGTAAVFAAGLCASASLSAFLLIERPPRR